eukprot:m.97478 g.97478  ORF g.97478 m.97478 type:complete len:904 (+) comp8987_c0_seq1:110-2821(+)
MDKRKRTKVGGGRGRNSVDNNHGGGVMNARGIDAMQFAASRVEEIKHLLKTITSSVRTRRVHQSLPRHMRRRATSHNVKRLPVRVRAMAQKEMDKIPKKEGKEKKDASKRRRSRRNRRRPPNLQKEYAKRAGSTKWLETHIWHAKRFKMESLWGWRVPLHSNEKSERMYHRSQRTACTIADMSFFSVFEICSSTREGMLGFMSKYLLRASAILLDTREHARVMVDPQNNREVIAPVSILCRPSLKSEDGGNVVVWISVHPAATSRCLELLERINKEDSVTWKDISKEICRFRLSGELSHELLHRCLRIAKREPTQVDLSTSSSSTTTVTTPPKIVTPTPSQPLAMNKDDSNVWESFAGLHSASMLMPSCTIILNVWDPRLISPSETKPVSGKEWKNTTTLLKDRIALTDAVAAFTTSQSISSLWDEKSREMITSSKLHQRVIDGRKSVNEVIGENVIPSDEDSIIPLILIQKEGAHRKSTQSSLFFGESGAGYGCGWDMLLPQAWARELWVALVYSGARAEGYRDSVATNREAGLFSYPVDFVGTSAERNFRIKTSEEQLQKHAMRPPAKRNNYATMGEMFPFGVVWEGIIDPQQTLADCAEKYKFEEKMKHLQELSPSETLSHKDIVTKKQVEKVKSSLMSHCILSSECSTRSLARVIYDSDTLGKVQHALVSGAGLPRDHPSISPRFLVPVEVVFVEKGTCDSRTELCIPVVTDIVCSIAPTNTPISFSSNVSLPPVSGGCQHVYRNVIGGLTSARFSFTQASPRGIGFMTLNGLWQCRNVSRAVLDKALESAKLHVGKLGDGKSEGDNEDDEMEMKRPKKTPSKKEKLRARRRMEKKERTTRKQLQKKTAVVLDLSGRLRNSNLGKSEMVVLAKHPDSRTYRCAIVRMVGTQLGQPWWCL